MGNAQSHRRSLQQNLLQTLLYPFVCIVLTVDPCVHTMDRLVLSH